MKNTKITLQLVLLLIAKSLLLSSCASKSNGYSGSGGMLAYKIKPEVYVYHYENGFTGVDSSGYDPNLQFAWSRAGAAHACGVQYDKDKVVNNMVKKYGLTKFSHDFSGIMFHTAQIKQIKDFCSPERRAEIESVVRMLEKGNFPKKF